MKYKKKSSANIVVAFNLIQFNWTYIIQMINARNMEQLPSIHVCEIYILCHYLLQQMTATNVYMA